MSTFVPVFPNAVFADGLIEQVFSIIQVNQVAAIAAFGQTQFPSPDGGNLDCIVDYHKGPLASPNFPCLTVTAGPLSFDPDAPEDLLDYHVTLTCWLDINYLEPEQLADWTLKYQKLLHQIFSTITNKFRDLTPFTTPQPLTWPEDTEERMTVPPQVGTVKVLMLSWGSPGVLKADDETGVPVKVRIPFDLTFHMMES